MKKMFLAVLLLLSINSFSFASDATTNLTDELNGMDITYSYANDRAYHVKFEKEGLSYQYLSGSKPEAWWGPFKYRAMKTEKGEYFVGWFEDGYGDYITLLFDAKTKILYGSGIIASKEVHFQKATISKIGRK